MEQQVVIGLGFAVLWGLFVYITSFEMAVILALATIYSTILTK